MKEFNKLPLNISKLCTDTITFKSELTKSFVKNVLYSKDEFLSITCEVN
jgi:hypothetical protein